MLPNVAVLAVVVSPSLVTFAVAVLNVVNFASFWKALVLIVVNPLGKVTVSNLVMFWKTELLISVNPVTLLKSTAVAAVPAKALASILVIPLGNVIVLLSPVTVLPVLPPPLLVSAVPNFTVANFALLANASLGIPVKLAGKVTVVKFGMSLKVPRLLSLIVGQLPGWSLSCFPVIPVPLKSILSNPLPWKAPRKSLFPALILLTLLGITIDVNFTVPAKLAAEIAVKVFGKVTLLKFAAFWKALLPKPVVIPVKLKSILSSPVP